VIKAVLFVPFLWQQKRNKQNGLNKRSVAKMGLPVLVDYLTFSIKSVSEETEDLNLSFLYKFLGLDSADFVDIGGRMHYASCWTNSDGITLYEPYSDRVEDMGYCVNLSGHGCRLLEKTLKEAFPKCRSPWRRFLKKLRSLNYLGYKVNISRIDIATDDISKDENHLIDLELIEEAANNRNFVSRFRNLYNYVSKNVVTGAYKGRTLYFGTLKSTVMCRFYDKLAEQEQKRKSSEEGKKELEGITHWVRMEFVFRRHQAIKIVNAICDSDDFAGYYAEVINGYIRFVEDDNTNKSRRTLKAWWVKFVGTVKRSSLSVGEYENYSFHRVLSYVEKYLSTTIYTVMTRLSPAEFFSRIYASACFRLKPKHLKIIHGEEREERYTPAQLFEMLNPVRCAG